MVVITASLEILQVLDVALCTYVYVCVTHTCNDGKAPCSENIRKGKSGHVLSVPDEARKGFNRKIDSAFDAQSAKLLCQIVQFVG